MKCSYCGHEVKDGAEFCEKCGMILGFADDKKNSSDEAEFTQNIFQALDFDDAELDVAAMELPISDYEETVEVSHNIPEYVSSPEDEIVADYTDEPEKAFEEAEEVLNEEIENLPAADEIPTIEASFEAPEYTPVPDVVISPKKASDAIKESNHKKENRKKKKHNKKIYAETYDIESISLTEDEAEIEKENEEAFKEAVKAPEIITVAPVVADIPDEPVVEEEATITEEPAIEEIPEAIEEPVIEEIPEAIEEPVFEEIPKAIEEPVIEEAPEVIEEPVIEEAPEAIEEPVIEEAPEAIEEPVIEEAPEAIEEPVIEEIPEVIEEPVIEEAPEVVEEPEIEEYEEVVEPVEEQPAAIGLFEDIGSASEEDEEYEEEEYEDITPAQDDKPVKKKSGKGLAVAAVIFIICVICAGAYALKDYIPVVAPTDGTSENESTVASTEETSEEESTEETTEEETTEEETSEETTEPEETTTEEAVTTEPSSENEVVSTTKPTTTKPTTTKPTTTRPTTTRPTTTRPTTTRPTTTRPTTTRPTTTKPSTTKPGTTKDPYGINDVEVKKPSNYVKSYTGYVTAEGLNMRAKPTTSSDRVLYLSKGADVKVLAKENGFLYVYSNRYGVSGWVSAAYISTSRPTETTSKLYTGTVQPDVKTAAKTMHTTYSLNIRKGPSTSYPSVQIIATGYPVKVLGSKSGVSGWVYVTDLTYGISGWVSTAYLK